MANGKCQMANGKWQMANGKWQMANAKWQMGRWQVPGSGMAGGTAPSIWPLPFAIWH
jgi:hypothetical protein